MSGMMRSARMAGVCALLALAAIASLPGRASAESLAQKVTVVCEGGNVDACNLLARAYWEGTPKIPKDTAQALRVAQLSCDKGSKEGCGLLANYKAAGSGAANDPAKVIAALAASCEGGDGRSCGSLGLHYSKGDTGLVQDKLKAVSLWEKGCSLNHEPACAAAGISYREGDGVAKNPVRAKQLFQRSCELGNPLGCNSARAVKVK